MTYNLQFKQSSNLQLYCNNQEEQIRNEPQWKMKMMKISFNNALQKRFIVVSYCEIDFRLHYPALLETFLEHSVPVGDKQTLLVLS